MLCVEGPDGRNIEEIKASMERCRLPFEELSWEKMKERYPQLNYPKDHRGLFDPAAGMLLNDRCLSVLRVCMA